MTAEEIIKQKEAEIRRLKQEIRKIEDRQRLSDYIKSNLLAVEMKGGAVEWNDATSRHKAWPHIQGICSAMFEPLAIKESGRRNWVYDKLDEKDKLIAADMADEIIAIWNKYAIAIGERVKTAYERKEIEEAEKRKTFEKAIDIEISAMHDDVYEEQEEEV